MSTNEQDLQGILDGLKSLTDTYKKSISQSKKYAKENNKRRKEEKKFDLTTNKIEKSRSDRISKQFKDSVKATEKTAKEYNDTIASFKKMLESTKGSNKNNLSKELEKLVSDNASLVADTKLLVAETDETRKKMIDGIEKSAKIISEQSTKFTLSSINALAEKHSKAVSTSESELKKELTGNFVDSLFSKLDANDSNTTETKILETAKNSITQLQKIDENNSFFDKKAKIQQAKIVKNELDSIKETKNNRELLTALKSQNDDVIQNLQSQSTIAKAGIGYAKQQGVKLVDGITGFLGADSPIMGLVVNSGKDLVLKLVERKRQRKVAIQQQKRDFAQQRLIAEEKSIQESHFKNSEELDKSTNEKLDNIVDNTGKSNNNDNGLVGKKETPEKLKSNNDNGLVGKKEEQKQKNVVEDSKKQKTTINNGIRRNEKKKEKNIKKMGETLSDIKRILMIMSIKSSIGGLFRGRMPRMPRFGRKPTFNRVQPTVNKKPSLMKRTVSNVGSKIKNVGSKVPSLAKTGGRVAARLAGRALSFLGPAGAVAGAGALGYEGGKLLSNALGMTNADGSVNEKNAGTKAIQGGLKNTSDFLGKSSIGRGLLNMVGIDSEDPAITKKRKKSLSDVKYNSLVKNGVDPEEAKKLANGSNDEFLKKIREINKRKRESSMPQGVQPKKENKIGEHLSNITKINNQKDQQSSEAGNVVASKALNVANKSMSNVSNNTTIVNNPNGSVQNQDVSVFNMLRGYFL